MFPSPIGGRNPEAEDDFTNLMIDNKAKPHEEESNNNNNITCVYEYPTIHRSVTDDDNVAAPPPPIGGNADFSSAILLGSSASNQMIRVAAPTSSYSCSPNAMNSSGQMQTFARAAAASTTAAALFPGPTLLMATTSAPKSSNLDTTMMVAATGKQNAAPASAYVEKWTCDVCKRRTFDTFEDANQHEISCKILHDAKMQMAREGSVYPWEDPTKQQNKEVAPPKQKQKRRKKQSATQDQAPPSMMQMALPSAPIPHGRHPTLSLIPSADRSNVLSEYNHMLVRNIEFFYPASSHLDYDNMSGSMNSSLMSQNRLGLRCIHCKNSPTHVTAAAFFPRTIGSIASGLGTVGTRHFGWGKCKSLKVLIVLSLRSNTHNTFQLQVPL
jgi:hypothetical protein